MDSDTLQQPASEPVDALERETRIMELRLSCATRDVRRAEQGLSERRHREGVVRLEVLRLRICRSRKELDGAHRNVGIARAAVRAIGDNPDAWQTDTSSDGLTYHPSTGLLSREPSGDSEAMVFQ